MIRDKILNFLYKLDKESYLVYAYTLRNIDAKGKKVDRAKLCLYINLVLFGIVCVSDIVARGFGVEFINEVQLAYDVFATTGILVGVSTATLGVIDYKARQAAKEEVKEVTKDDIKLITALAEELRKEYEDTKEDIDLSNLNKQVHFKGEPTKSKLQPVKTGRSYDMPLGEEQEELKVIKSSKLEVPLKESVEEQVLPVERFNYASYVRSVNDLINYIESIDYPKKKEHMQMLFGLKEKILYIRQEHRDPTDKEREWLYKKLGTIEEEIFPEETKGKGR